MKHHFEHHEIDQSEESLSGIFVLFGSRSQNKERDNSDYDILFTPHTPIKPKGKTWGEASFEILQTLGGWESIAQLRRRAAAAYQCPKEQVDLFITIDWGVIGAAELAWDNYHECFAGWLKKDQMNKKV